MLFLTVNTAATPRSNFGQMKDDIERLNRWCWQHNKALNLERGLVLHHNLSRGTTAQQPRRSSSSRSMAYHQLSRSFRLSFLAIPCIQYLATPPICITMFNRSLCISKEGGGLRTPTANHQSFYGEAISSLIKSFCLTLYLLICQLKKSGSVLNYG